jgi:hypothetical protein
VGSPQGIVVIICVARIPVGIGVVVGLAGVADRGAVVGTGHDRAGAVRVCRPIGHIVAIGVRGAGLHAAPRLLTGMWRGLWRLDSRAVGGRRPVELTAALAPHRWRIRERLVVTRWALGSEVMLAERL